MIRFLQVLSAAEPSKIPKINNGSSDTLNSSLIYLINWSKLKYLFDEYYKIISSDGSKVSASCQNCSKDVNRNLSSNGNFLRDNEVCMVLVPFICL